MPPVKRIVQLVLGAVVGAVAVWVEAVLETPRVKRRKAMRRRRRVLPKS